MIKDRITAHGYFLVIFSEQQGKRYELYSISVFPLRGVRVLDFGENLSQVLRTVTRARCHKQLIQVHSTEL